MQLTIVVPVLNEERSVERVARNCLDARASLQQAGISEVHVVVVSDGSTDRTSEIARSVDEVTTIALPRNLGYGAAIQRGWQEHPADLLAFLDGDGTCDAHFFVELVAAIQREGADIALGSRMGTSSRMPRLRRVGNWLFALLLGVLSRKTITDSASGMRIVRRSALKHVLPLPLGLHFTPAMSARALLSDLRVVEVPMPYAERIGRSKLSVIRDGLRFVAVIVSAAAYIRPSRLTLPLIVILLCASVSLGSTPAVHYLLHGELEESMIYRFLLIALIADVGVLVFCATLIAEHIIALGLLRYGTFVKGAPWWWSERGVRLYLAIAFLLVLLGVVLVKPGVESYLATGTISFKQMHWSRVVLAAFAGLTFVQLLVTRLLTSLLSSISTRQSFLLDDKPSG